jgi:hypothetical protein
MQNLLMRYLTVFIVSILICISLTNLSNAQTNQQSKNEEVCQSLIPENISTIDFCELTCNPSKYGGTVVRIKVRYISGPETMAIYGLQCREDAWAEYDNRYQKCTKAEVLEAFAQLLRPINDNVWGDVREADIVAVGLLIYGQEGFGHLNAFKYKFVIIRIEQAKAVPKK